MYLTPRVQPIRPSGKIWSGSEGKEIEEELGGVETKGWNGLIFVHTGWYEASAFKFKIDFPQSTNFMTDLPTVLF